MLAFLVDGVGYGVTTRMIATVGVAEFDRERKGKG